VEEEVEEVEEEEAEEDKVHVFLKRYIGNYCRFFKNETRN